MVNATGAQMIEVITQNHDIPMSFRALRTIKVIKTKVPTEILGTELTTIFFSMLSP